MKILIIIILFSISTANCVKCQSQRFTNSLGVSFIKNEYSGDYGNGFGDFSQTFNSAIGINVNRFFSKSFDISLFVSFGQISYYKNINENFNGLMLNNNLFLKYKFANDLVISQSSVFCPLLFAGFGTASFFGTNIVTGGLDAIFSFGPGVRFKINNLLYIEAFSHFIFTNKDHRDGHISMKNDVLFQHGVGLIILNKSSHYKSYQ